MIIFLKLQKNKYTYQKKKKKIHISQKKFKKLKITANSVTRSSSFFFN